MKKSIKHFIPGFKWSNLRSCSKRKVLLIPLPDLRPNQTEGREKKQPEHICF